MINNENWLRKEIVNTGITYYGYATPETTIYDSKWLIRKYTKSGTEEYYEYANNDGGFDSKWVERQFCFEHPSELTITNTGVSNSTIHVYWDSLSGVSRYNVSVYTQNGKSVDKWNNYHIKNVNNIIINYLAPSTQYTVKIDAYNRSGSTSKTLNISTI
jgi:hypothetical protein